MELFEELGIVGEECRNNPFQRLIVFDACVLTVGVLFRLTPWGNDHVSDSSGEAFYLRDEERGHFWSPTPLPCRGATPYVARHGFGYSVFEHTERGIRSEMWVYVALDAAVKFTVLKVHNESD